MNILFSPLGGTDPINKSDFTDGSMLHICRYYNIDKVYLYMTKEIIDRHNKDDRYRFYINKLAEEQNRSIQCEIIEAPYMVDVQKYDPFYPEFIDKIEKIIREKNDDDRLYINVSSGTPAIKGALLVLQNIKEYDCEIIQVSTPKKSINKQDEDLMPFWKDNMSKEEQNRFEGISRDGNKFKGRCEKVGIPELSRLRQEDIIKKLITEYDYVAALAVARSMEKHLTTNYIAELRYAVNRYNLHMKKVDNDYQKEGFDFTPVKGEKERKLFEYTLCLEIKMKRNEYIDFIRGITPIIVDLFECILENKAGIVIGKYCYIDSKKVRRWNTKRIERIIPEVGDSIKNIVELGYRKSTGNNGEYIWSFIKSAEFVYLIDNIIQDTELTKLVEDLRNIEKEVRNIAAHDIVSLDSNDIKVRTGFTPVQIMEMIKKLFSYTNFSIKSEYWNSYEDMNEELKRRISDHREEKSSC